MFYYDGYLQLIKVKILFYYVHGVCPRKDIKMETVKVVSSIRKAFRYFSLGIKNFHKRRTP